MDRTYTGRAACTSRLRDIWLAGAPADLRHRERVRRHVHVPWPAPPVAGRGRALLVPPRGVVGPLVERLSEERSTALSRRRLAPGIRDARVRRAGDARRAR